MPRSAMVSLMSIVILSLIEEAALPSSLNPYCASSCVSRALSVLTLFLDSWPCRGWWSFSYSIRSMAELMSRATVCKTCTFVMAAGSFFFHVGSSSMAPCPSFNLYLSRTQPVPFIAAESCFS